MAALPDEALELLESWLPDNDEPARPRMQLATVDSEGRPDLRTVLLSEWGRDGFLFHTDATSRKVRELAANPAAALALLLAGGERQLVVRGSAERAGAREEARAYARRSPYVRRHAWVNTPEVARLPRAERVAAWSLFGAEHDIDKLEAPATWVGFLIRPDRVTFWETDPHAPSHRLEFTLEGASWSRAHLPG